MTQPTFRIAIIGAGPLGIAAGRELLQQGFKDFTIFEKAAAAGGTWHLHNYPGLACDVWAHSYTFSYAPNPDWTQSFVKQSEIEAYLQRCVEDFGLNPHMRFNSKISRVHYLPNGEWQLTTDNDETFIVDAVINAMGNQHTPICPALEGIDSFKGESWHSTEWNHQVELTGKRVVVIGSAAAAVQIVPELAKIAAEVTVLQRSPNWIMPRGKKAYSRFSRRLFNAFPATVKALRWGQTLLMGVMFQASLMGHKRMEQFEKIARKHITGTVQDRSLHEALTPKSRFGCKRPLVSDDFYQALNHDHVHLIPEGAKGVYENGVVTRGGKTIAADVIIYCTGYKVQDYERIEVIGAEGRSLAATMTPLPEAYKGIAVPGFPNYFMGMGPNAMVLSASYFYSAEVNVNLIVRLLKEMRAAGKKQLSAKSDLHQRYNQWVSEQCGLFAWGSASCESYYHLPGGGSPVIFPGNLTTFKRDRENTTLDDFVVS